MRHPAQLALGFIASCGPSPATVVVPRAEEPKPTAPIATVAPVAVLSRGAYSAIGDVAGATIFFDGETYHDAENPGLAVAVARGDRAVDEPALAKGIPPPRPGFEQVDLLSVAGVWPEAVYMTVQRHVMEGASYDDYELYRLDGASGWRAVRRPRLHSISTSGPSWSLAARSGSGALVLTGVVWKRAVFEALGGATVPAAPSPGPSEDCANGVLATGLFGIDGGAVWVIGRSCDERARIDLLPASGAAAPQTIPDPNGAALDKVKFADLYVEPAGGAVVVGLVGQGTDDPSAAPYMAELKGGQWRLVDSLPMHARLTSVAGAPDGSLWVTEAASDGLWRRRPTGVWSRVSVESTAPRKPDGTKMVFTPKQVRVLATGEAWTVGCYDDGACGAVHLAPLP